MLCYDSCTICKPYVSRELFFYYFMPNVLQKLTPQFKGVINVSFNDATHTDKLLTYALPKTFVHPNSTELVSMIEHPTPHSKRCVRDYGKTHVIYPSDEQVDRLCRNNEKVLSIDDSVDELTRDLSSNLSFQEDSVDDDCLPLESSGLENPWNSKVLVDAWIQLKSTGYEPTKVQESSSRSKIKKFLLLENVTSPYRRPCILDLKMGTRVRKNPSTAKLSRHVTAIHLGARLSGMQIYSPSKSTFTYVNKYYGHNLTVCGLKAKLLEFFSRGRIQLKENDLKSEADKTNNKTMNFLIPSSDIDMQLVDAKLVDSAIQHLSTLRQTIATLDGFRFYSCSLLLIYEGDILFDVSSSSNQSKQSTSSSSKSTIDSKRNVFFSSNVPNNVSFAGCGGSCLERLEPKNDIPSKSERYHSNKKYKHKTSPSVQSGGDRKKIRMNCEEDTSNSRLSTSEKSFEKSHFSNITKSNADLTNTKEDCLQVDVRLIDFAHFCYQDQDVHPGPDGGFLYGLDKITAFLQDMRP